jgi:hypothetical protein
MLFKTREVVAAAQALEAIPRHRPLLTVD